MLITLARPQALTAARKPSGKRPLPGSPIRVNQLKAIVNAIKSRLRRSGEPTLTLLSPKGLFASLKLCSIHPRCQYQLVALLASSKVVARYRGSSGSFALLLAPLSFVSASLLKYGLGIGLLFDPLERAFLSAPENLRVFNLISPVMFLGGLALALALNASAVLRVNVNKEDGAVVGTVKLKVKVLSIAVAVIAGSSLLLVALAGYAVLENFAYR